MNIIIPEIANKINIQLISKKEGKYISIIEFYIIFPQLSDSEKIYNNMIIKKITFPRYYNAFFMFFKP